MGDEMTDGGGRVTNAVMRHEWDEFKREIRADLSDLKSTMTTLTEDGKKDREALMLHLVQSSGKFADMDRRFSDLDQRKYDERISRLERFVTQAETTAVLVKFIAGTSLLSALYIAWQLLQVLEGNAV